MPKRGFFFDLGDEMENSGTLHMALVRRIERQTQRTLVCYFANPAHPMAGMQEQDPDVLENILRSLPLGLHANKIDLLVNSPGGFPYAAAKMVKVCRVFSKEFRTIVLNRAMSAATLLCLGSDEVVMSETASLGPIDPQVLLGMPRQQRFVPASVIVESFKQMIAAAQQAISSKQPADPFLHILDSMDVTTVFESLKATGATKAIAKDLLAAGLLRNSQADIDKVVDALIAEGEKELHGKHLHASVLKGQIGLPVTLLPSASPLDRLFRELMVRMERYAAMRGIAKYFLTERGGFEMQVV